MLVPCNMYRSLELPCEKVKIKALTGGGKVVMAQNITKYLTQINSEQ